MQDNGQYIILPLCHDRDGLAETNGFTNGYACMSRETILKEWGKPGAKLITAPMREKALACLRSEIETYNEWANGEVYGCIIDRVVPDDDGTIDETCECDCMGHCSEVDSCWGFYGLDYAREEGLSMLRSAATGKDAEEHARTLVGLKDLANI